MTLLQKSNLLGSLLIFVGATLLVVAFDQVQVAIRNIQEFSFCFAGYLAAACAAAFGIIGLCLTVPGMIILGRARRQKGRTEEKV